METPCFTRLAMMAAHLLLLFAVQGARSSAQEIEHDGEVTGASGGVATLRCVYKGSQTVIQIIWYKEGGGGPAHIATRQDGKTDINGSFSPRLTFPGGSNTDGSISISSLRSSDIGTYICRFVINSGNKEASIKLTVLVGPEVSLKLGPRPLVSGQSGPQLVATCLATNGNPASNISWTMKSISGIDFASDILNGTKNRISSTGGGLFNVSEALKLTPTKEMNEATLTCVVKQPGIDTPIKKDATLDVHYKPNVMEVSGVSGPMLEGNTPVTLSCSADANPSANYSWTRNGTLVPDSDKNTLTLHRTVNNSGTYQCVAKNTVGSGVGEIYVNITPVPVQPTPQSTDKIDSSNNVVLIVAGLGALVVIMVIALVIFVIMRKRMRKDDNGQSGVRISPNTENKPLAALSLSAPYYDIVTPVSSCPKKPAADTEITYAELDRMALGRAQRSDRHEPPAQTSDTIYANIVHRR